MRIMKPLLFKRGRLCDSFFEIRRDFRFAAGTFFAYFPLGFGQAVETAGTKDCGDGICRNIVILRDFDALSVGGADA